MNVRFRNTSARVDAVFDLYVEQRRQLPLAGVEDFLRWGAASKLLPVNCRTRGEKLRWTLNYKRIAAQIGQQQELAFARTR